MAIDLDGTGDELSNTATFPISGPPVSISIWFNPDTAGATDGLISLANSGNTHRISLLSAGAVTGDPLRMQRTDAGGTTNTDAGTYTTGTWHHAGCWATSSDAKVYLNGSTTTTSTTDRNWSIDRIWLGVNGASGANSYAGLLADAAVWDIDLSDAEFALLANGICPLLIRPQNLVAYMPLIRDPYNDIVRGVALTVGGNPTVVTHPPKIGWYPYKIGGVVAGQVNRQLDADAGSYAVTGQTAALEQDRQVVADAGSYAVTGSDVELEFGLTLHADAGSYETTGSDAGLLLDRLLGADAGSYAITGSDADLSHISAIVLDGDEGSYLLTGSDAELLWSGTAAVQPVGGHFLPEYPPRKYRNRRKEVRDAVKRAMRGIREDVDGVDESELVERVLEEVPPSATVSAAMIYRIAGLLIPDYSAPVIAAREVKAEAEPEPEKPVVRAARYRRRKMRRSRLYMN